MKHLYNIFIKALFATLIVIASGCSDDFLDVKDPNDIPIEGFYQTEEDLTYAVNACYDPLYQIFGIEMQRIYYGYSPYTVHEVPEYENMTFSSATTQFSNLYSYLYRGVYRCNLVSENKDNVEIDDDVKGKLYGQAMFMRAMYNFYLAVCFNTPPLVNKTLSDDFDGWSNSAEQKQGDKESLMNQCLEDLYIARDNLPLEWGSADDLGRATLGAANTMLGKVHLWLENWDSARYYFNEVIQSGIYKLVMPNNEDSISYYSAFQSNFTWEEWNAHGGEFNTGSVYEINFSNDASNWNTHLPGYGCSGNLLYKYYGIFGASFQNISATLKAADIFEDAPADHPGGFDKDPRKYVSLMEIDEIMPDPATGEIYTFSKVPKSFWQKMGLKKYYYPHWSERTGYNYPNNWRLIRYADVLMMFAEADFHVNGAVSTDGLEAMNQIRRRVGMPEYDAPSKVTPDVFKQERLREFLYEINPTLHYIRWSLQSPKWVSSMTGEYNPNFVTGKHEYLPIPLSEIDFQAGELVQNPGY